MSSKLPSSSILITVMALIIGCCIPVGLIVDWLIIPPSNLPNLDEKWIVGPGDYGNSRWSPDGRYLAYTRDETINVYDTKIHKNWPVITVNGGIDVDKYAWQPSGLLSYLSADTMDSNAVILYSLHLVDLEGKKDRSVASNLKWASNPNWFKDGKKLVLLLEDETSRDSDVYLLDTEINSRKLLITRQELEVDLIDTISLSSDESTLLIYALQGNSVPNITGFLMFYNLKSKEIVQKINLDELFQSYSLNNYINAGLSDDPLNFLDVEGARWVVGRINATKESECYNYAIYFLNPDDLTKNFCIPSQEGIIAEISVSPDMKKIAYTTVTGPGNSYIMIANLTEQYQVQLLSK